MLFAAVAVFGLSVATAASSTSSKAKPECVDKCWTNSQYVSLCQGDHQCLCDDSEFQNAVYQCLYSQCSTSKFGTALHHALQACHVQEERESAEQVFDIMSSDMGSSEQTFEAGSNDDLKARHEKKEKARTKSVTKSTHKSGSAGNYPTGRGRPEHSVSVSKSGKHTRSVSASGHKSVHRPTRSVTKSATKSRHPHSVTKSVKGTKHHHSVTKSKPHHHSVTKSALKSKSARV